MVVRVIERCDRASAEDGRDSGDTEKGRIEEDCS